MCVCVFCSCYNSFLRPPNITTTPLSPVLSSTQYTYTLGTLSTPFLRPSSPLFLLLPLLLCPSCARPHWRWLVHVLATRARVRVPALLLASLCPLSPSAHVAAASALHAPRPLTTAVAKREITPLPLPPHRPSFLASAFVAASAAVAAVLVVAAAGNDPRSPWPLPRRDADPPGTRHTTTQHTAPAPDGEGRSGAPR